MIKKMINNSLREFKKMNKIPICILVLIVLGGLGLYHMYQNKMFEGNQNMEERGENEFMFLKMNGCGHCKAMQDEWDKLKQQPVAGCKFGEYEASKDKKIMKKYNVNSYPTLLLLPKGKGDPMPYEGGRTADAMRAFITKNMVS